MTSKELNLMLISTFPQLDKAYHEQVDWQEGDDTGSHVVYGDVLVPAMLFLLNGKRYDTVAEYFDFVESLLVYGDEYASDVVIATVIESIVLSDADESAILPLLGPETKKAWNGFE